MPTVILLSNQVLGGGAGGWGGQVLQTPVFRSNTIKLLECSSTGFVLALIFKTARGLDANSQHCPFDCENSFDSEIITVKNLYFLCLKLKLLLGVLLQSEKFGQPLFSSLGLFHNRSPHLKKPTTLQ